MSTASRAVFAAFALAIPLPAVAADPPFGARGYVTKAELDRVTFGKPAKELKPTPGTQPVEELKAAIKLLKEVFKYGEPIPFHVILKNTSAKARSLPFRLNLVEGRGGFPHGFELHLKALDGQLMAERARLDRLERLRYESKEFVAGGYYVASTDLNELEGGPLSPGKYELYWSYSSLSSNAVAFTVEETDTMKMKSVLRRQKQFLVTELEHAPDDLKDLDESQYRWKKTVAEELDPNNVVAKLGLGVGGKHYPDPNRIPATDDALTMTAEYVPGKDGLGGRLSITFTPKDKEKTVILPSRPRVAVFAESTRAEDLQARAKRLQYEFKETVSRERTAPKTLVIDLPDDVTLVSSEAVKYAVVVSSDEFELPRELRAKELHALPPADTVVWSGVLRAVPIIKKGGGEPIVVTLNARGELLVPGGAALGKDEEIAKYLTDTIAARKVGGVAPKVVLRADRTTKYADVVRVLDACKKAGATEIVLEAPPEREEK